MSVCVNVYMINGMISVGRAGAPTVLPTPTTLVPVYPYSENVVPPTTVAQALIFNSQVIT